MKLTKTNGLYKVQTPTQIKFTGSLSRAITFIGFTAQR